MDSLTRLEVRALGHSHNLADGHARHHLSAFEQTVIDRLPEIYRAAEVQGYRDLENGFLRAFFKVAGQRWSEEFGRAHLHYASSVAIAAVAALVARLSTPTGLIHPTFDSIPSLLVRAGVKLIPVDETVLSDPVATLRSTPRLGALFVVVPNNPTGATLDAEALSLIAEHCRRSRTLLVLDLTYRFFGNLHRWDQYQILRDSGVNYIVIEDTGKTWPTQELKVGLLVCGGAVTDELSVITEELLLSASPFTLVLLSELLSQGIETAASTGVPYEPHAVSLVRENRHILRKALESVPLEVVNYGSQVSVEWLRLHHRWSSLDYYSWLLDRGVAVLPGGRFFWADDRVGDEFVRVALARPRVVFGEAVSALVSGTLAYQKIRSST
jgi:aspartate/methionine/tyrosine aminotransferase